MERGSRIPMQTRIFLFICFLVLTTVAHGEVPQQSGIVIGNGVNFRAEPSFDGLIICVLKRGIPVAVLEQSDLWYKARLPDGQAGWIHQEFVELKPPLSIVTRERFSTHHINEMITYANSLLGIKYVYGGQSLKGFDCSGFTMHVFAKMGINLPHQSDLQMKVGMEVSLKESLLPGDLVFFKTLGSKSVNHVGIYLGDGRFIHASSGYGAVRVSPINSGYYNNCYAGGSRLINTTATID